MILNKTCATATTFLLVGTLLFANECRAAENKAGVSGVVKYAGPRPKRTPIYLIEGYGKISECGKGYKALLMENLIVGTEGGLANTFVYVSKGVEKKDYPLPKQSAVLDQKMCMYRPRIQGVRVGQEFVMRNSDGVIHNVRSFSFINRAFNIAQPPKSDDRKRVFDTQEKSIKIGCDFHPWMTAYIFVVDHPYFTVTDEKGQFKIGGLPKGDYTVTAWHEEFGRQKAKISVDETGSAKVDFTFEKEETE